MKIRPFTTIVAAFALALPTANLSAAVVTVSNPSFEIVDGAVGDSANPTISVGWVASDPGLAFFNPADADFVGATDGDATPSTVPDGLYAAFLYGNNTITQTLSDDVSPGAEYTLTLFVGNSSRFDYLDTGHTIELRTTDGDTIISKTASDHASPSDGEFVFVSFTGTAPLDASGDLEILFTSTAAGVTSLPFIDHVGLAVEPIPEPASALMLFAGMAGMSLRRRRA